MSTPKDHTTPPEPTPPAARASAAEGTAMERPNPEAEGGRHRRDAPPRRLRHAALLGALAAAATATISFAAIALRPAPEHTAPAPVTVQTPDPTAELTVVPVPAVTEQQLALLPEATTYQSIPAAPRDSGRGEPTVVLYPKNRLVLFDAPGGKPIAKLPTTQLGSSPTALPVLAERPGWVHLALPNRPNGSTGWAPVSAHSATLSPVEHVIRVERARFELTLLRKDSTGAFTEEVGRWKADIGKPASPTPAGRTFLLAQLQGGPLSPTPWSPTVWPLGLHSESYFSYGGGPGTTAIHGWHNTVPRGEAVTDGCIRIPPEALKVLEGLDLGTPVLIS